MTRLRTSCILATCRRRIPLKRQRRNAITCSTKHQKLLVRLRKEERDRRICQQCGRPCSEREKLEFRRWRAETGRRAGRHAKRKPVQQNPILEAARAIKSMAYVCPERGRKGKNSGAAA